MSQPIYTYIMAICFVYVYTYIYIYIYMYIHVHIYIYIYTCLSIYSLIDWFVYLYIVRSADWARRRKTVDFRNVIVFFWAETLAHWNPTSCRKTIRNSFARIWDSQIESSKIEIMETDRTGQMRGRIWRRTSLRATLDVPKPKSGGLVRKVGPFSKRTIPL